MIQIDQIYEQLKAGVKFSPEDAQGTRMRINTFAVIPSWSDLDSDNFGKYINYKDTPFFYSRRWENLRHSPSRVEIDYPVMVCWETSQSHSEVFSHLKQKTTYSLHIAVLDRFFRSAGNIQSGADARVKEQIYIDTERMVLSAIKYLGDVIAIEVPGQSNQLIHEDLYELLDWPAGTKRSIASTKEFEGMLRRLNNNIQGNRWEGGKAELLGTFITLNLELQNCLKPEFNFHTEVIPPVQDRRK